MNNFNLYLFLMNLGIVVFIAALMGITPMLNRKSLLFGVRVPESAAALPESRKLKRNYVSITVLGCLVVLGLSLLQYILAPHHTLLGVMYFPLLMAAVDFMAFIPQWKKAKTLKEQHGWQVPLTGLADTRSAMERQRLSTLPWIWYIASAALVLAGVAATFALYSRIPEQIPLHWGADMEPTRWGDRNIINLMLMPLIALGTIALMAGTNMAFYKQKLQVSTEKPALSFAQHRMYRRMMSHGLGFMTLNMTGLFLAIQAVTIDVFDLSQNLIVIATVIACTVGIAPLIYVQVKAGQSGNKLKPDLSSEHAQGEQPGASKSAHPGRGDDRYWKLGMFYCNPDDPAMLVESRFGGNSGFNYSRLPGKIFLVAIALLLVGTYAWMTYIGLTVGFV